ncbi:uncharacterized protein LOC124417644 [Gallus gallus]|uniref:uncharacterized protein LOC124417644 n=1 Tax=Gallus gallus TaxID=9031 RepID=UPI001F027B24|nr:uncharacterized protein LOC124417644 [Gallus gallus]
MYWALLVGPHTGLLQHSLDPSANFSKKCLNKPHLFVQSLTARIIESSELEGTFKGHPVQLPCNESNPAACCGPVPGSTGQSWDCWGHRGCVVLLCVLGAGSSRIPSAQPSCLLTLAKRGDAAISDFSATEYADRLHTHTHTRTHTHTHTHTHTVGPVWMPSFSSKVCCSCTCPCIAAHMQAWLLPSPRCPRLHVQPHQVHLLPSWLHCARLLSAAASCRFFSWWLPSPAGEAAPLHAGRVVQKQLCCPVCTIHNHTLRADVDCLFQDCPRLAVQWFPTNPAHQVELSVPYLYTTDTELVTFPAYPAGDGWSVIDIPS